MARKPWGFTHATGTLLLLGAVLTAEHAAALDPKSTDARAILRAALDGQTAERSLSSMKMTIRDKSGTRERLLSVRAKRFSDARKTLIQIEQPADVRNTGFLAIDHRAQGNEDEQWLYLPKLHRTSRVPSSGKSDPFVGSDFTVSDLSPQDPEAFNVKLVQAEVKVGDESCWLLETTPRTEQARDESGYEKMQLWVSKEKLLTVQSKAWLIGGAKTKYFKASDVRKVAGIWTAHRLQMRTLDGANVASETLIEVLRADNEAKQVVDSDFTQQRLEQGV